MSKMSDTSIIKEKSTLPLDKFPEWQNDQRMNALFAPFRKTSANQQDHLSKCDFWKRLIHEYLKYNVKCSFSISELEEAFERNGLKPQCLTTVIQNMLRSGEILSEINITRELNNNTNTWGSWMINAFIKKPVTWSFTLVKSYIVEESIDPDVNYISLQSVKNISNLILDSIDKDHDNKMITFKEFSALCKDDTILDEHTALIILSWMSRLKKVTFRQIKRDKKLEWLIKVSRHEANEITEIEMAIDSLRIQEELLMTDIETMEQKKEEAVANIKKNLASGLWQLAKSWLRKKIEIEKNIENRSNSLANIQKLAAKIHDAKADTGILQGYKTAYDVLKKLEKDGLTQETVKETMDNLAEVIDDFKEMESTISEPVDLSSITSDLELEQELNKYLEEECEIKTTISLELPDITKINLKELPTDNRSSLKPNSQMAT